MMTKRADLLVSAWLVVLALPGPARAEEREFPAREIDAVSVDLIAGDIHVVGWDEETIELVGDPGLSVQVEGRELRVHGGELQPGQAADDADDESHDGKDGDGRDEEASSFGAAIEALVHQTLASGRAVRVPQGGDVALRVPRRTVLSLSTVSGDVDVRGTEGRLQLTSVSGEVGASGCSGPLTAESVSGGVTIAGVTGDATLETVSGDLVARRVVSSLFEAKAVDGRVELKGIEARNVRISSHAAGVSFQGEITQAGTLEVKTFSGAVLVKVPVAGVAMLEAKSVSGAVELRPHMKSVQRSAHRVRARNGVEGAELRIESFSGAITIEGP